MRLCAATLERATHPRNEGGPMARIALVTGTSSGIGLSTAVSLARNDFTVVATMRNLGKAAALQACAQADGVALDVRQLDVQDEHSVYACVPDLPGDHGLIDVLVNKPGAGFLST